MSKSITEFVHDELVGGVGLILATLLALVWANTASESYVNFWSRELHLDFLVALHLDLHDWVNDGLMALFFFVVGLELKRELTIGELSRPRDAAMPIIGAIGGMVVPAGIYAALNFGGSTLNGWAIPIATDIAFVLGVLAMMGKRVPPSLRLFLLAVAIVDDLGGIIIIALFYTDKVNVKALAVVVAVVVVVMVSRRWVFNRSIMYLIPGILLWIFMHESGVHATLAGVVLGMLTPAGLVKGKPLLDRMQHRLHPLSALVVVPLFALSNAGVVIEVDTVRDVVSSPLGWGVFLGLVIGKPVGIASATLIAKRFGVGNLPAGVQLPDLIGGAAFAGIGFTVALFIADLSFTDHDLSIAKFAILIASMVAALVGSMILILSNRGRSDNYSEDDEEFETSEL